MWHTCPDKSMLGLFQSRHHHSGRPAAVSTAMDASWFKMLSQSAVPVLQDTRINLQINTRTSQEDWKIMEKQGRPRFPRHSSQAPPPSAFQATTGPAVPLLPPPGPARVVISSRFLYRRGSGDIFPPHAKRNLMEPFIPPPPMICFRLMRNKRKASACLSLSVSIYIFLFLLIKCIFHGKLVLSTWSMA